MFQITDVNVLLAPANGDGVLAYVAITVDGGLVVRDLKIVNGPQDVLVVFPSRKLTDHCPNCDGKNHLRARYCNDCGHRLDPDRALPRDGSKARLTADVAHPISREARAVAVAAILRAYREEAGRSHTPGSLR